MLRKIILALIIFLSGALGFVFGKEKESPGGNQFYNLRQFSFQPSGNISRQGEYLLNFSIGARLYEMNLLYAFKNNLSIGGSFRTENLTGEDRMSFKGPNIKLLYDRALNYGNYSLSIAYDGARLDNELYGSSVYAEKGFYAVGYCSVDNWLISAGAQFPRDIVSGEFYYRYLIGSALLIKGNFYLQAEINGNFAGDTNFAAGCRFKISENVNLGLGWNLGNNVPERFLSVNFRGF